MTTRDAIPRDWIDRLADGPVTLGLDLATTEKKTSNPSSLSAMEHVAPVYIDRLLAAWKTEDPDITTAIIDHVFDDLARAGRKVRRLCIDASNEVFFAKQLRKRFMARCPVELIKGGENLRWKGEEMPSKILLGNLYVNALEDGLILLPAGDWIADDHRLVKREKGSFVADLGKNGEHGDTFDGGKLAYWGHVRGGGRVQAEAVQVGSYGTAPTERPGLKNQFLRRVRQAGGYTT